MLVLVLVAVGVMNMAWTVALTAVVFVEKVWRSGEAFGYSVGAALILTGLLLPWLPHADRPLSCRATTRSADYTDPVWTSSRPHLRVSARFRSSAHGKSDSGPS